MDVFCRACGAYPWRDPAPIADPPRCLTVVDGEAFVMVDDALEDELAPIPPEPGEVCPTCGKRRASTAAQRAKKARAAKAAAK